jgi:2-C-methyl-D-erythritol 4-phosphate cytidylyltransferase
MASNTNIFPDHPHHIWAVIPAGGSGQRYGGDKLAASLSGQPVLQHTLTRLCTLSHISGIVVACPANKLDAYQQLVGQLQTSCQIIWVAGGPTRRESVYNGLKALPDHCDIVLVHDAARPLISQHDIEMALIPVINGDYDGTVLATPVSDTIKQTHDDTSSGYSLTHAVVKQTQPRESLWAAQTPQVFFKNDLLSAQQAIAADTPITDDAQLVELAHPLKTIGLIQADYPNLKITHPKDITLAEWYLSQLSQQS